MDRKIIACEYHPNDSRMKLDESGTIQTLTTRMGTGGNNVPCVIEMREPTIVLNDQGGSFMNVTDNVVNTLRAEEHGHQALVMQRFPTVALEGNGQRPSHFSDVYKETDVMCTLNTTEVRGVAYAFDRATYNQGKNALYDITIEPEISPPLVARGPGGVFQPIGATSEKE